MSKVMKMDKVVGFDELTTPMEGLAYEVEFTYPSSKGGNLLRRGVVVHKYDTPSIKLSNMGGASRPYSTYTLERVVGPIRLVALHKEWVDPHED